MLHSYFVYSFTAIQLAIVRYIYKLSLELGIFFKKTYMCRIIFFKLSYEMNIYIYIYLLHTIIHLSYGGSVQMASLYYT